MLMKFIKQIASARVSWVVILFVSSCVIICAFPLYYFKKTYSDPYNRFLDMKAQALPHLDELNEQTFQTLPAIPEGFSFMEKNSFGIKNDDWHIGRWMTITINGSLQDADRFYLYYKTNLLNTGWKLAETHDNLDDTVVLYKGKSCVRLSIKFNYDKEYSFHYLIEIWQDFIQQPFVSNIPSNKVLGFYLWEDWKIATCP
jgi:hypothetical protein